MNKNSEIEKVVKDLAKQSTAPDKETPDWMEADIRRGILAGIELQKKEQPQSVEESEDELWDDLFTQYVNRGRWQLKKQFTIKRNKP